MRRDRRWRAALAEHDASLAGFVAEVNAVPRAAWHASTVEGRWSPAEEALHIAMSYEAGLAGLSSGAAMHLRVTPTRARLLHLVVLPIIFHSNWFPRGAAAPREVHPSTEVAHGLSPDLLVERLQSAASQLRASAPGADEALRIRHAYFGALTSLDAVRMLSAHTRHHTRTIARWRRTSAGDAHS